MRLDTAMGIREVLPSSILDAIANNKWKNPGPKLIHQFLHFPDSHECYRNQELYESIEVMAEMWGAINKLMVTEPWFCIRQKPGSPDDYRLVLQNTIFLGGSSVAGDDEYVAVDLVNSELLVIDYGLPCPKRWKRQGSLESFVEQVATVATSWEQPRETWWK